MSTPPIRFMGHGRLYLYPRYDCIVCEVCIDIGIYYYYYYYYYWCCLSWLQAVRFTQQWWIQVVLSCWVAGSQCWTHTVSRWGCCFMSRFRLSSTRVPPDQVFTSCTSHQFHVKIIFDRLPVTHRQCAEWENRLTHKQEICAFRQIIIEVYVSFRTVELHCVLCQKFSRLQVKFCTIKHFTRAVSGVKFD